MSGDVVVTLTYTLDEARRVIHDLDYFDSNVTALYEQHDRMGLIRSAIQLALPVPKPPEPTGLGAVVEDVKGRQWVNVPGATSGPWFLGGQPGTRAYADVDAVRVLSEGVTR